MYTVIIIIGLICLFLIVTKVIRTKTINKKFKNNGFIKHHHKIYDYSKEKEDCILYIKIVVIPSNSMITINNKYTWKLSYGGSKSDVGRAYPNSRYLNELVSFLKEDIVSHKEAKKIVVLYKESEKILRHINESELKEIKENELVYGYKIIHFANVERYLIDSSDKI